MTEKDERLRDFACCCDENAPVMVALREEVCADLECEPADLVTAVVKNLYWTYDVEVTGIPCDMWAAVKSEWRRWPKGEEADALPEDADDWVVEKVAWIECDRIEDGFALTWKTWKQWFETRSTT